MMGQKSILAKWFVTPNPLNDGPGVLKKRPRRGWHRSGEALIPLGCLLFCISCLGPQTKMDKMHQNFSDGAYRLETYEQSQLDASHRQQKALSMMHDLIDEEGIEISERNRVFESQLRSASGGNSLPEKGGRARTASQIVNKSSASLEPVIPASFYDSTEEHRYFLKAAEQYKQKNYESAAEDFLLSYSYSKDEDLKVHCLFWIGECHRQIHQWDKALKCYQLIEERYPNHALAPRAILQEGSACIEEGSVEKGRALLRKLIQLYPQSNEAASARERLKESSVES
ncbi:MAG: tetratricopeptide repeat protein [Candidatus Omnitrophica bacterium]|nr:tetratricopeptide repeat protein [Candidatus Omnitrophota bacterium]